MAGPGAAQEGGLWQQRGRPRKASNLLPPGPEPGALSNELRGVGQESSANRVRDQAELDSAKFKLRHHHLLSERGVTNVLPSDYPEVQSHPHLKNLLANQIDMQIEDLRGLLQLPLPEYGLAGGCNFTAGTALFNIIAGASVCFFKASVSGISDRRDRSARFKEVLTKFYPWGDDPSTSGTSLRVDECVNAVYDSARNPLVHTLGLDDPMSNRIQVVLAKNPLTPKEIAAYEGITRPAVAKSTIVDKHLLADGSTEIILSVPTLYWGVHRMLRNLFADASEVAAANALAAHFSARWDKRALGPKQAFPPWRGRAGPAKNLKYLGLFEGMGLATRSPAPSARRYFKCRPG